MLFTESKGIAPASSLKTSALLSTSAAVSVEDGVPRHTRNNNDSLDRTSCDSRAANVDKIDMQKVSFKHTATNNGLATTDDPEQLAIKANFISKENPLSGQTHAKEPNVEDTPDFMPMDIMDLRERLRRRYNPTDSERVLQNLNDQECHPG